MGRVRLRPNTLYLDSVPAAYIILLVPLFCPLKMTDAVPLIPTQLLADFDAAVLRILATVDDGSIRCVQLSCRSCDTLSGSLFNGNRSDRNVEQLLTGQISELIRQRDEHRNSQQPIFRLSFGLLVRSIAFLQVQDLLSVIKVCRHLRASVCEASSLWTHVDEIDKPSTLRFVLRHAKSLPVSITGLYMNQAGNDLLQVVASHMWHVRALGLYLTEAPDRIPEGTNLHTLFTTPAPLLQRISFSRAPPLAGNTALQVLIPCLSPTVPLFGGVAPLLDALYVHGVLISVPFISRLPNPRCLKAITYRSVDGRLQSESVIWNAAHNLHHATFNIELANWGAILGARNPATSLRRINIRWTSPVPLFLDWVIPRTEHWKLVHIVHVTHAWNTAGGSPYTSYFNAMAPVSIPTTNAPYSTVYIRGSMTSGSRVNVRALDVEGRERIFCGLQRATVTGLLSRIPSDRLSTITINTAAVALGALFSARLPTLQCMRLVSNTSETSWVGTFAHDILSIMTLERIEFTVEGNPRTVGWTTKTVLRILGSCLAAGCALEKVVFLGFQPEARCVSLAATFAEEIIVDRNWREPLEEHAWFTEPSFEWM